MTRRTHVMPGNLYPATFSMSSRKLSQLDRDTSQLVNFDDGGLYAPSGPIVIGGLGMTLSTASSFSGHITTKPGYGGKQPMFEMATTWPTFSSARTVVKMLSFHRASVSGNTAQIPIGAQVTPEGYLRRADDTFGNAIGIDATLVADDSTFHDGATLTKATAYMQYTGLKPSTVPLETFQIIRVNSSNATSGLFLHSNGTFGSTTYSSGVATRVVANVDEFYNDGKPIAIVYEPNQNNVIDKSSLSTLFRVRSDTSYNLFGIKLEYLVSDQRFE